MVTMHLGTGRKDVIERREERDKVMMKDATSSLLEINILRIT